MLNALQPNAVNAAGRLHNVRPFEVQAGYGGAGIHSSGRRTIVSLAKIHNDGIGLVQRKIIVPPDSTTKQAIFNFTKKEVTKRINRIDNRL